MLQSKPSGGLKPPEGFYFALQPYSTADDNRNGIVFYFLLSGTILLHDRGKSQFIPDFDKDKTFLEHELDTDTCHNTNIPLILNLPEYSSIHQVKTSG